MNVCPTATPVSEGRIDTRRTFLKMCGTAGLYGLVASLLGSCRSDAKPNVVFVLVDDLGWRDLGCYGSTFYETPEIDRFAGAAMRFTDAYAASPVCSPTRASILTGRHPARLHITDWIPGHDPRDRPLLGPRDRHQLPLEERTLAESLQDIGYRTFFAGKWHLGQEGFFPEDQGFDVNQGGHHRGSPPGGYYSPYENPMLSDGPDGEYLPDRLTDESISFVDAHRSDPFFLNLWYYTVHTPIEASKRHVQAFEQKADTLSNEPPFFASERDGRTRQHQDDSAYASMIRGMDENFGRLWQRLEEGDLIDRTIVVFTSDNGGLSTLRQERAPTSNLPLRAGKGWCYEGGIRVPLILHAPGITAPGSVCTTPVTSTDLYPTLLELTEAIGSGSILDGVSLVPLLKGSDMPDRMLFWHYPHYHGSTWSPGAAVRSGPWKLIQFYEEGHIELYNLSEDLEERNDLSTAYPRVAATLLDALIRWQQDVSAQMPAPNPEYQGGDMPNVQTP